MLSTYFAYFYTDNTEDPGYNVLFPDFGYLATCGDDLNHAMEMAIDCLAGCLYDFKVRNMEFPSPMSSDNAMDILIHEWAPEDDALRPRPSLDYQDAFNAYKDNRLMCLLVPVDVDEYVKSKGFEKRVKKTVTIPDWINKLAEEKGINFSRVLEQALKKDLGLCEPSSSVDLLKIWYRN